MRRQHSRTLNFWTISSFERAAFLVKPCKMACWYDMVADAGWNADLSFIKMGFQHKHKHRCERHLAAVQTKLRTQYTIASLIG